MTRPTKKGHGDLQSVLFKNNEKGKIVDSELDDIFRNSAGASASILPTTNFGLLDSKRKRKELNKESLSSSKKRKLELRNKLPKLISNDSNKRKRLPTPNSIEDEDDQTLEDGYLQKQSQKYKSAKSNLGGSSGRVAHKEEGKLVSEDDSDDEQNDTIPTHESKQKELKSSTPKTTKYMKPDETKADKDRRTIFIGNLSVEIAKSKAGKKAIINHIRERVPGCKVDSVRFRSVAFKKASVPLTVEEHGKQEKLEEVPRELSTRQQRDKERVTRWQEDHQADEPATKVYLKSSEKRRVAFIKQEFHEEAATVNAYMVFAYSDPNRSTNVPSPMDPFTAAQQAVGTCDNTVFMDRTIRVDRVVMDDNLPGSSSSDDMKRTIFVGNLDFTAKEEELRKFFETLVEKEVEKKGSNVEHVKHVRIIRDGSTQLGKGFAYVEFKERFAADEILAMESPKLKFAKRKLRVQRCKTMPGSTLPKPTATSPMTVNRKRHDSNDAVKSRDNAVQHVPKGDPSLGDKLRTMTKEERKVAKSADPNRVARRLAKKKARSALHLQEVGLKDRVRSKDARHRSSSTKSKQQTKGRKHGKALS